jgi:hypothetical protein
MRSPKSVHNNPCHACRTGGAVSRLSLSSKPADSLRRYSAVDNRYPAHLMESTSSVNLGPRPVTPERAAKKIGSPPRKAKLPAGIIRLPNGDSPQAPQSQIVTLRPLSRLCTTFQNSLNHDVRTQGSSSSSRRELEKEPASPKLHYLHGLPKAENFPYVHKREIPAHAAALRARSTSPLTQRSVSPQSSSSADDYSQTVYYGGKTSPFSTGRAATQKPHVTTALVDPMGCNEGTVFGHQAIALDVELSNNEVYKERSSQGQARQTKPKRSSQAPIHGADSRTVFGSRDTGSTKLGDKRLEPKGGDSFKDGTPRLRGGSGREGSSTNTFSFKLKRWLLTCHGPYPDDLDTDSDADLPPARVVTPEREARVRENMNGRALLPAHLSRSIQTAFSAKPYPLGGQDAVHLSTVSTTIEGPFHARTKSFRLSSLGIPSFLQRQSESPINQPVPKASPQSSTLPIPTLRGGAGSPGDIPPTLFWLAGGRGRPISFSSWKHSRPKQRMGGLFGMAVHGRNYGKEYGPIVNGEGEVVNSCTVNIEPVDNDTANRESAKSSISTSSSSSSSGSSSAPKSARDVPTSARDGGPAQRASTPPPNASADEVPPSGALPTADLPAHAALQGPSGDSSDGKVNETASEV